MSGPSKKPTGPDVIMVLATTLAAVAAIASAVAAFRQERATFDVALYGKQVETFGAVRAAVSSYYETYVSLSARPLSPSELPNTDEIEKAFRAFGLSIDQAQMVAPEDYRDALNGLARDGSLLRDQILRVTTNSHSAKDQALSDGAKQFLNASENLESCAYKFFVAGEAIERDTIKTCFDKNPKQPKPGTLDFGR
jgi:hypothetical protein